MRPYIQFLLILLTLYGCNGTDQNNETLDEDYSKSVTKPFSDSLKLDTFNVKINGKDPKKMSLIFTINSFEGKEIYHIDIKATDLFKNYDATIDLNKKKNQIKFLHDEIDRFFDEENFMEPAITDQETADKNVPDKVFYEELKKSQLNGFIYRLGKENKIYIGWSPSTKKVATYYSCCK